MANGWKGSKVVVWVAVFLVFLLAIPIFYFTLYQGRDFSRYTGVAQKIDLPECVQNVDQVVSISFHSKTAGATVKDVTYKCDGRLFSQEYNDSGFLEGSIEWTIDR